MIEYVSEVPYQPPVSVDVVIALLNIEAVSSLAKHTVEQFGQCWYTNIGTAATNTNDACACSEENEINHEMWEKGVRLALKKIQVQDLGNMNASELQLAIPMEDSEGRGMTDLISLEKKLAVKVVFDQESGHVLIVGDEKKLEKKVFVIRNMISHYHWRLSGTDVAFDKITSTTR